MIFLTVFALIVVVYSTRTLRTTCHDVYAVLYNETFSTILMLGGKSASLYGGFRTVSVGEEMRLSGNMGVGERRKVLRRVTVLSFPVIVTCSYII